MPKHYGPQSHPQLEPSAPATSTFLPLGAMTRTIEILIGLLGKHVSFMAYEIIPVKVDS